VGAIPPNEVENYIQRMIGKMKKTSLIDAQTGQYNMKFNQQNLLEDFFIPVRGNDQSTRIDTAKGLEYNAIEDVQYFREKLFAALKIPKAFMGYEKDLTGKATLAAEDIRFARTIERIQRIITSELTKIAIVHLVAQGYENAELLDFELSMTSPSTIYEQEKLTLYNTKVDLAKSMLEGKIISKDWIFKNVFNFTEGDIEEIEIGIIKDQKDTFRMTKIAEDGEDPADPRNKEKKEDEGGEEKEGSNPFGEGIDEELQKKYDKRSKNRNTPEVPEGGWPGSGRPKESIKYNSHEHPRGYDPIGKVAWKNSRNESVNPIKKYGLEKLMTKKSKVLSESSIMDETIIIQEDI
jgi:hypothetical protein